MSEPLVSVADMEIVGHEENSSAYKSELPGKDGELLVFRYVVGKTFSGKQVGVWICNKRPGYFRMVFVPQTFKHDEIVNL